MDHWGNRKIARLHGVVELGLVGETRPQAFLIMDCYADVLYIGANRLWDCDSR